MRRQDYKRLAKISLASRKSSTRSTVRGISFGLILLIPVIFVAVALYSDLNAQVDKTPELLFAQIDVAAKRTGNTGYAAKNVMDAHNIMYGYQETDKLIGDKATQEVFVYEQVENRWNYKDLSLQEENSQGLLFEFSVGGSGELVSVYNRQSDFDFGYRNDRSPYTFAAIMDLQKSTGVFSKKITNKFNGVYLNGMDKGFTNGGKGQVILAEALLNSLGLQPEEVYGNTFSLKYRDSSSSSYGGGIVIDNNNDASDNSYADFIHTGNAMGDLVSNPGMVTAFLCYEYEVVGIVKSDVTEFAHAAFKANDYTPANHLAGNLMFFSDQSLIMDDGTAIEPVINTFLPEDEDNYGEFRLATYLLSGTEIESLNKDSQYMALGANLFSTMDVVSGYMYRDSVVYARQTILFEATNYRQLDTQIKNMTTILSPYFSNADIYSLSQQAGSYLYAQLSMIYSVLSYLIMVLSVIGGIIFFAAMVNLFNSIVHSVDLRRNYLGVMRAIGAKNSVIPRLYRAEAFTIFRRALVWIIIFSGLICYGLKALLDMAFVYVNSTGMLPITLGVNIIFIPVSIGIGIATLVLLGVLFSYGCSRTVAKSPITEVLGAS